MEQLRTRAKIHPNANAQFQRCTGAMQIVTGRVQSLLLAAAIFTGAQALLAPAFAQSADTGLRLGIMVPRDGNFAILGDQIINGVTVMRENTGVQITQTLVEPDTCDAEGGTDAASAFVEAGVDAVIGFLCLESLTTALPILSASGIPSLSLGVRSGIVAEDAARNNWLFFRMAPRADDEARKITYTISTQWLGKPLALIEDGTIYGRELTESVRLMLEEIGISPIFTDNFRPSQDRQFSLVRRLEKSGATHVFVGGDRQDIATIVRDSADAGLQLEFLGGDALNATDGEPALANGVLAVTLPQAQIEPSARRAVALFDAAELGVSGYTLPAFAATQVLLAARDAHPDLTLAKALKNTEYETVIGPIEFDSFGERKDNPFELMVWYDGVFVPSDLTNDANSQGPSQ